MKYILTITFCCLCGQIWSQLPDYYVYLVSGSATLTKPKAKPILIKQNQLVYKSDVLVLRKGTEVTLADKDGNFLVLNKAKTYIAGELSKNVTKRNKDGLTTKYLKLLYEELLDPSHNFEKFIKGNKAGVIAGVSRGENDCGNMIFPSERLKTSSASIVFKWHATNPSSEYSFFIYDSSASEIVKLNVKDSQQSINITEKLHGKTGKYYWLVSSKDSKTGTCEDEVPIGFELLTPENEKEQAERLIAGMDNGNMEKKFRKIEKLEMNGFIDIAMIYYAALVKESPDDFALRKSYVLFLWKCGFDNEAVLAWK